MGLWLRWSWRDLRARWVQVVAIALVIALGTGSYAGLLSLTDWRRISSDRAYEQLQMYDLRVRLPQSLTVAEGQLLTIAGSMEGAEAIEMAEERLIAEVQVDASTGEQTILVQGLLYGLDVRDGGPGVNKLYAVEGRGLEETDRGELTVVLEHNFGKHYSLPPEGEIRISGGQTLSFTGQVLAPEYFLVTTEQGGLLAEANFAAIFASLETVQQLTGQPGRVNDLVLALSEHADAREMQRALQAAFDSAGIGATVMTRDDDPSYYLNDRDIYGDRQTFQILALLVFGGAVGAAFNLSARIVDSQRREIGIAMALGLPSWRIALRPMLVGAQVALLGVVFGLGVGYLIGQAMISLATDLLPLPEWQTPFQFQLFATVAVFGFAMPLLATAWPVWRAVRVPPIETIKPAYRSGRGGGLAPFVHRLRLPGNTLQQAPIRNVVRSPRRTLLTSLGIAAALAALVSFIGMIDSFIATTDRGDAELLGQSPERIEVRLTGLVSSQGEVVQGIATSPVVDLAEPGILIDSRLQGSESSVDLQLELMNLESRIWHPNLIDGEYDRSSPGIYISELAARDLGLEPGEVVSVVHPQLRATGEVAIVTTDLPVLGIHPHPFRFIAYMDVNHAGLFGMSGLANRVKVLPAENATRDDVKKALIDLPGVASMESVGDVAQAIRDLLDEFVVVLRVVEVAMLLIALLIAFNAASINMDERTRENATMFAFGISVPRVVGIAIVENFLIGVLATGFGIVAGWFLLRAIIATRIADTMPDIYIQPYVSESTLIITIVVGILCVTLAPLLTWRRLARMNIPGALKVME